MPYTRKTADEFVIQQYMGNAYGWEDVDICGTRKEAKFNLKLYRENQPEYPSRLITRRVKIIIANFHKV